MTLVSPTAPSAPKTTVTFVQMLEKVRYEGAYPTRRQAQDVLRRVLEALGRQLTGDERVELAARLPGKQPASSPRRSPPASH
ncbi:hypothetical protein SAV14893_087870 [Streptomyces avermitilis]|uniref:DUF2267 domain-containing protein n=1 Tax=Streptomyces avermitilis TaxID=33903 RepID=A0A4D4MC30_STRAX|nr:hypothetical protein SAV14893_087870 [Streptomyces avermitilis]